MPNPVPFSVNPALRGSPTGQQFLSPSIAMQAGWTKIFWELNIPSTTDYENVNNSFVAQLLVGGDGPIADWIGGPYTNKNGTVDPPPAFQWDISQVPAGTLLQVGITVTAPSPFNIGIQNGLIS